MRSFECTLATTTSTRAEQLLVLVERAVFQDVDFHTGEDPERREVVVERVHDFELLAQTVGREPVGDLQAGRVVGEREILVPEVAGLPGHRRDRVAAVRPVRVRVQVALQVRAQRLPRVGAGLGHLVEQLLEVRRCIAVERLDDHRRSLRADPGDVGEPPVGHEAAQLVVGDQRHFARGVPKGLLRDTTARAPASAARRSVPAPRLASRRKRYRSGGPRALVYSDAGGLTEWPKVLAC